MIAVSALYRVSPLRSYGFAPQFAVAIFSGFLFSNNKKWAFILPLISMFLSDVTYEVLYNMHLSDMYGFYGWEQLINYALVASTAIAGILIGKLKVERVALAAFAAPTAYYILSNLEVWAIGIGYLRPKTFAGLMAAYNDGYPFYKQSLAGTAIFSLVLFGVYYLYETNTAHKPAKESL